MYKCMNIWICVCVCLLEGYFTSEPSLMTIVQILVRTYTYYKAREIIVKAIS